ncbi:NFATC2-interacting protein [Parambassis ranga]|uniref:NFATC2-interacting protein n=1 Tax=Parambassis ranga TaxID=210632 RepID=A0A6P7IJ04_9TELE|nr:NFATC2-interacting protein [Parambassis ranga]
MAETVADGEVQGVNPPPKRRRILDPSAIVSVPVYSNKVNNCLQMKPAPALCIEKENTSDGPDESLWSMFPSRGKMTPSNSLSDEEDEVEYVPKTPEKPLESTTCPSPPPPESPVQKQSRKVKAKINDINRRLQAVSSLMSPNFQDKRSRLHQGLLSPPQEGGQDYDDDDVIIMSPALENSSCSSAVREIPLKVRCRTDVQRIPVLSSTPLMDVVNQMSVITNVPPARLLLLREDVELPTDSTVSELGLCITDIIDCVVMAAEDKNEADNNSNNGVITVRLQSKDKDSSQEFSLHREAPLGSVFSQYLSRMSAGAQEKVRFHFDGSKVKASQTPAQLDMEDGDIIEVWL